MLATTTHLSSDLVWYLAMAEMVEEIGHNFLVQRTQVYSLVVA